MWEDVGLNKIPCPVCQDDRHVLLVRKEAVTGVEEGTSYSCHCLFLKNFWQTFMANVSPRYQYIARKKLAPSTKSRLPVDVQRQVLKQLHEHPLGSYSFFGPAGTSKTTFAVALYRCALLENTGKAFQAAGTIPMSTFVSSAKTPAVWRISAKQLVDEFQSVVSGRPLVDYKGTPRADQSPLVTRQKILRAVAVGLTPRLFMEEVDKVSNTEFRVNCMFEVIDAIYEAMGQLVLVSNMTREEFKNHFGADIARRVKENEDARIFDFHTAQ